MDSCAHTDTRTHTRTHTHDWNACCFCLICSACTTLSCFSCPRGGLSLAHSRTHAHSIAFSLSHPHVLYFSRSLLLFLSRKHTPTNTHPYTPCSRTQIHTHTHSLSLSLCLSLSLNLTHTHISAARTCCKPSSYSLLHSHTSSPTHAPPHTHCPTLCRLRSLSLLHSPTPHPPLTQELSRVTSNIFLLLRHRISLECSKQRDTKRSRATYASQSRSCLRRRRAR